MQRRRKNGKGDRAGRDQGRKNENSKWSAMEVRGGHRGKKRKRRLTNGKSKKWGMDMRRDGKREMRSQCVRERAEETVIRKW